MSRIDHMEKIEKPKTTRQLTSEFDSGGYAAKEILAFRSATKGYGSKTLFAGVDLSILRDERIALIGENGSGKTTLMKIMMGEEEIDRGEIKISPSVKCGYMPQFITFSDENATVLDILCSEAGTTEEKARSILFRFLFEKEDIYKTVDKLSGGEKSRLKLCLLMQKNSNFLLLDEPTNHLDIASREWMENALMGFDGTIFFVSHDRYFQKKFAQKIWDIESGNITQYNCRFDEYLAIKQAQEGTATKQEKAIRPGAAKKHSPEPADISIETKITQAESLLKSINTEIENDVSSCDFSRMNDLQERKNQLLELMNTLYNDWATGESDE